MSKDIENIKKRFPLPENPQQTSRDSSTREVKDSADLPKLPQLIRWPTSEDLSESSTEQSHEEIAVYIAEQLAKIREELSEYSKEDLELIAGTHFHFKDWAPIERKRNHYLRKQVARELLTNAPEGELPAPKLPAKF